MAHGVNTMQQKTQSHSLNYTTSDSYCSSKSAMALSVNNTRNWFDALWMFCLLNYLLNYVTTYVSLHCERDVSEAIQTKKKQQSSARQNVWPMLNKISSGDEIANVNFCTTTSHNTSKYNPLLNIQHDAGRGAASGCGLVLVRKSLQARRLATTEYSCEPRSRAQHGHGLLPVQQSRGRATMAD